MAKYILTNKAVEDLSAIWNYTCEVWSERQADKYYYMLLDFCRELAENKMTGKKYDEIDAEIFGFKANRHIIFYRKINKGEIVIVRILHSRMDLKSRMQE